MWIFCAGQSIITASKMLAVDSGLTHQAYLAMLERFASAGYRFARFTDAESLLKVNSRFVLMRHDIDMSLGAALELAKLEAAAGVSATYFLMLRTEHYNVLSSEGSRIVAEILRLGHHLGLHFDCACYPAEASVANLNAACQREARLLGEWCGREVEAVSYHRPNAFVLAGDPQLSAPLPHTYMPLFTQSITYYSDSRGRWGHGHPLDSEQFQAGGPLHILVHPVWWNGAETPAEDVLKQVLWARFAALDQSLADNCQVHRTGRLRLEEVE